MHELDSLKTLLPKHKESVSSEHIKHMVPGRRKVILKFWGLGCPPAGRGAEPPRGSATGQTECPGAEPPRGYDHISH